MLETPFSVVKDFKKLQKQLVFETNERSLKKKLGPLNKGNKKILVLLFASVERLGVSGIQYFLTDPV